MEYRFPLQDRLSDRQAHSLVSKAVYSIEGIDGLQLDESTQEVVLQVVDQGALPEIVNTLERMVEAERTIRHLPRVVIKSTETTSEEVVASDFAEEVHQVFQRDGAVRREEAVYLMDLLEKRFLRLAQSYQARLRNYPAMIERATLEKCGYTKTFPQNLFHIAEYPHQRSVLEKVKTDEAPEQWTRLHSHMLTPAICFHCYQELSGQVLSEPLILTAEGHCFRHEAPWRVGGHRLYEFSMREIVYVGDPQSVRDLRSELMEDAWKLFLNLGMQGRIETAFDPFYFPEVALKETFQLMSDLKYELIVTLPATQTEFSVASFNLVGDSFCKAFEICDEQQQALHSGCVGFGIERWVYALLSQHGVDLTRWPSTVLKELGISLKEEGERFAKHTPE
jgi:seryl-tRNA synthetase